ncbi:MAG: hypothetical protein NTW13_05550 [Candidatus Omnitrophica bacterium]|nr:hypothetical protein [Candidatus Omnitrophota bacterium]
MKKILLAILAVTFISSLCFAAGQSTAPVTKAVSNPSVVNTFRGNVESVTLGDSTKKVRSEITVVGDKGQKLSFAVRPKVEISGKDGKATTLGKVAKGDKVVVEYTTTQKGTRKANSIKLVE